MYGIGSGRSGRDKTKENECRIQHALKYWSVFIYSIDRITGYININMEYISILLKMLGISYICEFATNICKDAGYGAIASHIELAGRVTMVVMSLPILFHVIDMVVRLMG